MTNDITAVAIDKDKHSQAAVKWAVENLLTKDPYLVLIHVRVRNQASASNNHPVHGIREKFDSDIKQLFLPFRGFCARKGVRIKEVVLDDVDVAEAIVAYINHNIVSNIVVGGSNRGYFQSWGRRTPDVPTTLTRASPDFCSVYVIAKGKPLTTRPAICPPPVNASLKHSAHRASGRHNHEHSPHEEDEHRRNSPTDGAHHVKPHLKEKATFFTPSSPRSNHSNESLFTPRTTGSHHSTNSDVNDYDYHGFHSNHSRENSREFSNNSSGAHHSGHHSGHHSDIEAEMRRLKLELKQTMEMYSNACREAVMAKQKTVDYQKWQVDEARKFEDVRLAEESALALAKMEKARAQAALEAAEASKKIAQLEAKRRKDVEMKAMTDAEERGKVLDALENRNIRYRKYDIEDIRIATRNFSPELKIGEGGYGPVYKAFLDHTPVAVKVLRSDAVQGMRQFQQEVEVLSCIRHPNMVLLLGANPESGCLVYEYLDNGSLEDRLLRRGNTAPLPWWTRFKISAEIATALLFLHQTRPDPLVHRDLKPANILLDHNFVSKISDVGLARLVPPSVADTVTQYHMTSAAGTFCYIDPEYQQTGMLGTKSDIYSLGIMLLQIITAKPPMGLSHYVERSIERGNFEDLLDPSVPDWPVEEALSYAKLALRCTELRKKDRPDLGSEILPELNRLRSLGYSESCNMSNSGRGAESHRSSTHGGKEPLRTQGETRDCNSHRRSASGEGTPQLGDLMSMVEEED